jgi:hypothetical protein
MLLALVTGTTVLGQTAGQNSAAAPATGTESQVAREINDPGSGSHWLLLKDGANPGGPGRMVLAAEMRKDRAGRDLKKPETAEQPERAGRPDLDLPRPIIHIGDHLIVEQHTPVMDAAFEALAMAPAVAGAAFEVRLTVGGKVLRAVALAPGRAALAAERNAAFAKDNGRAEAEAWR